MRPEPRDVVFGDKTFRIRPLTLRQTRQIEPIVKNMGPNDCVMTAATEIFRIALERDHPDACQSLDDVEITLTEAALAMQEVLRLGGFVPQEGGLNLSDPPPPVVQNL